MLEEQGKRVGRQLVRRSFCQLIPAEEEAVRRIGGGRRQFAGRGRLSNFSSCDAITAQTEGKRLLLDRPANPTPAEQTRRISLQKGH